MYDDFKKRIHFQGEKNSTIIIKEKQLRIHDFNKIFIFQMAQPASQ